MTTKWCCYCGRPGHHAHACDWPRDVPPPVPAPEPTENPFDDQQEDWMEYYGGY